MLKEVFQKIGEIRNLNRQERELQERIYPRSDYFSHAALSVFPSTLTLCEDPDEERIRSQLYVEQLERAKAEGGKLPVYRILTLEGEISQRRTDELRAISRLTKKGTIYKK